MTNASSNGDAMNSPQEAPIFRVRPKRFEWRHEFGPLEKSHWYYRRGRAFSATMEQVPMTTAEHRDFLWIKIQIAERARRRSGCFWGRLINRVTGEQPDYALLNAMQLRQTCAVLGLSAETHWGSAAGNQTDIEMRIDALQQAHTVLSGKRD